MPSYKSQLGAFTVFVALLATGSTGGASYAAYDDGAYSSCAYGVAACPGRDDTKVSAPIDSPTQVAGYFLNVKSGQEIPPTTYTLTAQLINPADTSLVGRIEFWLDGQLLGRAEAVTGGRYQLSWDVRARPGTRLRSVLYDAAGNTISQEVVVRLGRVAIGPDPKRSVAPEGGLAGLVPEALRQALRQTPPVVAQSFPYGLFFLLFIMIGLLLWRARQEARRLAAQEIWRQEVTALTAEKDTFIQLTSHYLRTPLTYIKNGIDLMGSLRRITPELARSLKFETDGLSSKIELLLAGISDQALHNTSATSALVSHPWRRVWSRLVWWLPLVVAGGLAALANFLFIYVAGIDITLINQLIQVLVFGVAATGLYLGLRTYESRRDGRRHADTLLLEQRRIDVARNQLIHDSVVLLAQDMQRLRQRIGQLEGVQYADIIRRGYGEFDSMLEKFKLVGQLEGGRAAGQRQVFDMAALVSELQATYATAVQAKQLQFVVTGPSITVTQSRPLLTRVLGSLLDNAIRFSRPGGRITLAYDSGGADLALQLTDTGTGIAPDKLPYLFQPFSRSESALVFDHAGLGFSLYLDRLIMRHLGGDITVASESGRGTTIKLTFPVQPTLAPVAAVMLSKVGPDSSESGPPATQAGMA